MVELTNNSNSLLVVGICGCLRSGSYTRMALRIALRGAAELGVKTELVDLADYELPFCDGGDSEPPADVLRLRDTVRPANGLILGTPEYHGGFSGMLKYALDLMGDAETEGKLIGLVGVSAGSLGGINGINALRTVGRSLHAWVIPEQAAVPHAREAFRDDGTCSDRQLEERILDVGRQMARFSYLLTSEKAKEFLQAWESATPKPRRIERLLNA